MMMRLSAVAICLLVAGCEKAPAAPAEAAGQAAEKAALAESASPAAQAAPAEKAAATEKAAEAAQAAEAAPAEHPALSAPKAFADTDEAAVGTLDAGIGLAVGTTVPGFTATQADGTEVSLSELLAKGPVLIAFYRGGWCPFCNYQVQKMSEAFPRFQALGVTPVMVSVDAPDGAEMAKKAYDVPFPILSDPEGAVMDAFKVGYTLDEPTLGKLKGYGLDIEAWAGNAKHRLPHPGIFLVGTDSVVRFAHAAADYKTRPSVDQLIKAIEGVEGLGAQKAAPAAGE